MRAARALPDSVRLAEGGIASKQSISIGPATDRPASEPEWSTLPKDKATEGRWTRGCLETRSGEVAHFEIQFGWHLGPLAR